LKRIELLGTKGSVIMEESLLRKWEFAEMTDKDLEINQTLSRQSISHGGGASNPMDISFLGHQRQIEDFLQAIETDRAPLVDAIEGRKSVEIVFMKVPERGK
jgi:predicted dehydrogenase